MDINKGPMHCHTDNSNRSSALHARRTEKNGGYLGIQGALIRASDTRLTQENCQRLWMLGTPDRRDRVGRLIRAEGAELRYPTVQRSFDSGQPEEDSASKSGPCGRHQSGIIVRMRRIRRMRRRRAEGSSIEHLDCDRPEKI